MTFATFCAIQLDRIARLGHDTPQSFREIMLTERVNSEMRSLSDFAALYRDEWHQHPDNTLTDGQRGHTFTPSDYHRKQVTIQ